MPQKRHAARTHKDGEAVGGRFARSKTAADPAVDPLLTLDEEETSDWEHISTSLRGARITWHNNGDGVKSNRAEEETWFRLRTDGDDEYWNTQRWRDDVKGVLTWGGNIVSEMIEEGYVATEHDQDALFDTSNKAARALNLTRDRTRTGRRFARKSDSCAKAALNAIHDYRPYQAAHYQATAILARVRASKYLATRRSTLKSPGHRSVYGTLDYLDDEVRHRRAADPNSPFEAIFAEASVLFRRTYGDFMTSTQQQTIALNDVWVNDRFFGERGDILWQILKEKCAGADAVDFCNSRLHNCELGELLQPRRSDCDVLGAGSWGERQDADKERQRRNPLPNSITEDDLERHSVPNLLSAAALADEEIGSRVLSVLKSDDPAPYVQCKAWYCSARHALEADSATSTSRYTQEQLERLLQIYATAKQRGTDLGVVPDLPDFVTPRKITKMLRERQLQMPSLDRAASGP